jgi:NodT family efflux transporter outer membrane factor (OMF) lipoprotein
MVIEFYNNKIFFGMKRFHKNVLMLLMSVFFSTCKPTDKLSNQDIVRATINDLVNSENSDAWSNGVSEFFQDTLVMQLIEVALENNLSLKQNMQNMGQARAALISAKGLSKPFIEANAAGGVRRFGFYTQEGIGNWDANFSPNLNEDMMMGRNLPDYFSGFLASWEIDVWGKLKQQKKSALHGFLASEQGYNWLRMQIATKTIMEYVELVALLQKKEILNESIQIQELALSYAQVQKELGGVNQLVVNQLEARLNNFKSSAAQLDLEIRHQYNALNFILGRYPSDVPIHFEILNNPPHISFQSDPQTLLDNRPDVKQAELLLLQSGADIEVARRAFYPSLQVSGLLGLQTFNADFFLDPSSTTFSIFGGILGPIFNRSAQKANLEFAKASHEQNFYFLQSKVMEAYYDVLNQSLAIDYLSQQLRFKTEEVGITKTAIYNVLQLFKSGRVGYLDMLTVQSDALSSQMDLVDVQQASYMARINLYRALGGF